MATPGNLTGTRRPAEKAKGEKSTKDDGKASEKTAAIASKAKRFVENA